MSNSDEGHAGGAGVSDAAQMVIAERQRQQQVEGWSEAHDDLHTDDSLAIVAACYALTPTLRGEKHSNESDPKSRARYVVPDIWPRYWHEKFWKPTPKDRVRELVKAGALIIAEIERLQRATIRTALASGAP